MLVGGEAAGSDDGNRHLVLPTLGLVTLLCFRKEKASLGAKMDVVVTMEKQLSAK